VIYDYDVRSEDEAVVISAYKHENNVLALKEQLYLFREDGESFLDEVVDLENIYNGIVRVPVGFSEAVLMADSYDDALQLYLRERMGEKHGEEEKTQAD
jgi:hypothetical protein